MWSAACCGRRSSNRRGQDTTKARSALKSSRAIEDRNIRDAVKLQEEIGLAVVTDGEYRRLNFQDSFGESVAGFDAGKPSLRFYEKRVEGGSPLRRWEIPDQGEQKGTAVSQRRPVAEKIRLARNVPMEEFRYLRQVARKAGQGCADRAGPDCPTLRLAEFKGRLFRSRRICRRRG